MPMLNVLVAGSTGYIGIQLVNLLTKHKFVNIKYLCGNTSVGKNIAVYDRKLTNKKLPKITKSYCKLQKSYSKLLKVTESYRKVTQSYRRLHKNYRKFTKIYIENYRKLQKVTQSY